MKNIMGMMGQIKNMQDKMQEMQSEIQNVSAEGKAGGDAVTVTLNGKGIMTKINIQPNMLNENEAEVIEDLIVAAHNNAKNKLEEMIEQKTKNMMGDIKLPPGLKLPF